MNPELVSDEEEGDVGFDNVVALIGIQCHVHSGVGGDEQVWKYEFEHVVGSVCAGIRFNVIVLVLGLKHVLFVLTDLGRSDETRKIVVGKRFDGVYGAGQRIVGLQRGVGNVG